MSNLYILFLIPLAIGLCTVLQGGLNRQMANDWGLASAVFLNNIVFLVLGALLLAVSRLKPNVLPDLFNSSKSLSETTASFGWWYLLPGFFGCCIVCGIPLAISRLGAYKVFVGVIVAQLIGSLLWDQIVSHTPITAIRLLGAGLAILAATLVMWKA